MLLFICWWWSESRSLQPHGLYYPGNSPGQNIGVGSISFTRGDLPNPGIEPRSPTFQVGSFPAEPPGKTCWWSGFKMLCWRYLIFFFPLILFFQPIKTLSKKDFLLIHSALGVLWFPFHLRFCFKILTYSRQRRQWHPTPVLLPGKSHGQRSLVGCSPWGR